MLKSFCKKCGTVTEISVGITIGYVDYSCECHDYGLNAVETKVSFICKDCGNVIQENDLVLSAYNYTYIDVQEE